jgi:hypothetical protein
MVTGGKIGRQTVEGVLRIEGILLQHHFWCNSRARSFVLKHVVATCRRSAGRGARDRVLSGRCIVIAARSGKDMFQKYKEIIFGIGFGIAALIIDTAMDGRVEGNSFVDESAAHPGMMFYRLGFVLLGLAFGWLLWKNRTREREFRLLKEALNYLQQQCEAKTLLLRADLQLLLTRNDFQLPDEAQQLVRDADQRAQEIQRLAEEKLPS